MKQNIFTFLLISFACLWSTSLHASSEVAQDSIIALPIKADLKVFENHLNIMVPQILAEINEPNKICVKAQYLRTKSIPKCKIDGYRLSCKDDWLKIKTFPKINCDIKGWVRRDGLIALSGEGETLKFSFPVKAKVSIEAGIRETATASAILYLYVTPHINKDWSVSVDIKPHFVWSKQPTIKLLELVEINIKNSIEPQLQKKIKAFVKKVPKLLKDLNLKEKIHTVWQDIQKPIKLRKDSETYLLFKPKSASYSGFKIVNNILSTNISLKGSTEIIVGKTNINNEKIMLCNLETSSFHKGNFNFNIPVSITYQEVLKMTNKKYAKGLIVDLHKSILPGILQISDPKIEKSHDGYLSVTAHIRYDHRATWLKNIDIFDWFDVNGEITFKGIPKIDTENRCLTLDKLVYDSSTNSDLFDVLVDAAALAPIKSHFTSIVQYKFGEKLDKNIMRANKALKKLTKENLKMFTSLQMVSIEAIQIHEKHIIIDTKLSGKVNAIIGF